MDDNIKKEFEMLRNHLNEILGIESCSENKLKMLKSSINLISNLENKFNYEKDYFNNSKEERI